LSAGSLVFYVFFVHWVSAFRLRLREEVGCVRDYALGAFEALTWVKGILVDKYQKCEDMQEALSEIEKAISDIEEGVTVDFLWRLKSH
jgi:hypothetical protein